MTPPVAMYLLVGLLAVGCASDPASSSGGEAPVDVPVTDVEQDIDDAPVEVDAALDVVGGDVVEGDASMDVDAGPAPVSRFTLEITIGGETELLFDETFEGYQANEFGAEVYADVLKIWGGDGDARVGVYFRTDDNPLPGSAQPGVPGSAAWLTMTRGTDEVYSTQMVYGDVVIENCPAEVGELVRGRIEAVRIYDLVSLGSATLDGTFEVVLGAVAGDVVCGEL